MLKTFNIITLFPELFDAHLQKLPFKKALEKNLIKVNLINLRDFAVDKRGTIDDKPYGGGVGMILMVEPIYMALDKIYGMNGDVSKEKVILLSATGSPYNQQKTKEYLGLDRITLICGRYEGVDKRVENLNRVNPKIPTIESISIGNFVLSGGEIPALAIMESITRIIPTVLEKGDAVKLESFTNKYSAEHPQYTRPENFMGLKVPSTLLSGNHKEIESWKKEHSK